MKKIKLISLLALGIASFIAYSNGAIASETGNNSEVSDKSLIEDGNLLKNIKLPGLKVLSDYSVPITETEGVKEILSEQAGQLYAAFSRKLEGVRSISYGIVHEGDKLSFVKFNVAEGDSDNKQGDASVLDESCPVGLRLIKICYTRSCVEDTLAELGQHFSNGDTIYVHHSGLGGVIICSDIKMN
ncbi:hypothetical protein [Cephaloticoccus capnophilus]|uniref:hypothetical protein n=1 Tax=Cephaloticoccus capnophilus TaxID=1548208 RepID=UPI0012E82F9A|nr:hypothetical protein [Cephaloticoccus capnophilus]